MGIVAGEPNFFSADGTYSRRRCSLPDADRKAKWVVIGSDRRRPALVLDYVGVIPIASPSPTTAVSMDGRFACAGRITGTTTARRR
jgi:hypothetical protein